MTYQVFWTPLDKGAVGNGVADDRQPIVDAYTESAHVIIPHDKTFLIGTDLTIPAGITMEFQGTGKLRIPNGVKLTINGKVVAPMSKIFDLVGTGQVEFGKMYSTTSFVGQTAGTPFAYAEWWGAAPEDSSAPQMTANVAAFTAALNSHARVCMLAGYYSLNGTISPNGASGVLEGAGHRGSCLVATTAVPILSFAALTNFRLTSVLFLQGTKAFTFNTQEQDNCVISIQDCTFQLQTGIAIEAQSGSNSTELNIERCVWQTASPTLTAAQFVVSYCDYTRVIACWATFRCTGSVFVNRGSTFKITDLVGVPAGGAGATACWLENYGHCELLNNRFGSEDDVGRTVLWQKNAGTNVRIEGNYIAVNDYAYKFDEVPEQLTIRGNFGYGGAGSNTSKGLWFKGTSTEHKSYMERGKWILDDMDFPASGYFSDDGTTSKPMQELAYAKIITNRTQELSSDVLFADAAASIGLLAFHDRSSSSVTVATGAYPLLGGVTAKKLTCTANPGTYVAYFEGFLPSLTEDAGIYTAVLDFYVASATRPFWLQAQIQKNYACQVLHNGLNILCFQFQADGKGTEWSFNVSDIPNGAVVLCGRIRMFKGAKNIRTVHTEYSDLSSGTIPNNMFVVHYKGDRVVWSDAASGGYTGKVCTTQGQPGTFKDYGLIA